MVRASRMVSTTLALAVAGALLQCVGEDPPVATPAGADSSPPDGSGSDASRPEETGTRPQDGRFCDRERDASTRFCSDFEDGRLPGAWQGRAEEGDGGLSIDGGGAGSSTGALTVSIPVSGGGDGAYLVTTLAGGFSTLACSFQLRRDLIGGNLLHAITLDVATTGDQYRILVNLGARETRFRSEVTPLGGDQIATDIPATLPLEPNEYHLITIELAPPNARLLADGQVVATVPIATSTPTSTRFDLGVVKLLGTSMAPWLLRYDDVRCHGTP